MHITIKLLTQLINPETNRREIPLAVNSRLQALHLLYDKYAGMLLGYIMEVVKDRAVAEQQLIAVFNDLPYDLAGYSPISAGTFCRLQLFTRQRLAPYFEKKTITAIGSGISMNSHKYHSKLDDDHNHVFCGLHYHGKTTAILAKELNKSEDVIRKLLKEAFAIMRRERAA